jgi:O-antigen ligase
VRGAATAATGVALAAAVGVTALDGGGFSAPSQALFVVLAGIALLAAVNLDGQAIVVALRSPLGLTLVALSLLSVASAVWTVDGRQEALRWGLAMGGYAAVYASAAALARRAGRIPFAAAIAILALIEALLGLDAVAMRALPEAERIAGHWRPGGTFEYPPALALLQVGALPVLCALLSSRSGLLAGAAGAAAVLAGAVLGLSQSRLAGALAIVLLLALLLRPPARRDARPAALASAALVAAGALLGPAFLHSAPGAAHGRGMAGMAAFAALAAALGAIWPLARSLRAAGGRRGWAGAAIVLACAAVAVAAWPSAGRTHAAAHGAAMRHHRHHATPPQSGWLHGRGREWSAALRTWLDRPLLGAGAGAYYTASLSHQGQAPTRYAHDLPLELAAELGLLGLLIGAALYASTAWSVWRAPRTPALWLLAPLVLAFLASNLLDWTWHLTGLGALWAASCGALPGARRA